MEALQATIIKLTKPLVRTFSWKKVLISTTIYVVIVSVIIFIALGGFDLVTQVFIILFSFAYTFFKDRGMEKHTGKVLDAQHLYLQQKYEKLTLYIPMLDKVGKTVLVKRASLFFEGDWMFLEAFRHQAFSINPRESIKIPYGKEFIVSSITPSLDGESVEFKGTLLGNDYHFMTCYQEEFLEDLQKIVDQAKGELKQ